MSYSLLMIRWKIETKLPNREIRSEEQFSFHADGHEVKKFLEWIEDEEAKHPEKRYRRMDCQTLKDAHGLGNLRDEVHQAKQLKIHGIWKKPEEVALLQL